MAASKLVFIHGFLEDATMWQPIISGISKKNYQVWTPELPGHGKNQNLPEEINTETWCRNILQQIDFSSDDSLFIVAHSMGGYLSATIASMIPQQVNALCLFHSKSGADDEAKLNDRRRAIAAVAENKELYVRTMLTNVFYEKTREKFRNELEKQVKYASQLSVKTIQASQQVMIERQDRVDFMKERKFPLFYFLGEKDSSIPAEVARKELASLPGAVAQFVPEVGHMGHIECRRESIGFIQRVIHTDV